MRKNLEAAFVVLLAAPLSLGWSPAIVHQAQIARGKTLVYAKKRVRKDKSGSSSPDLSSSSRPIPSQSSIDEDKLSLEEWMELQSRKAARMEANSQVEEAVIIPEVNELLEKRNRKSKSSGLDLDAFITDDNDGIQQTRLPDFDEVKARRAARSTEEGVPERSDKKLAGAPASPEEEAPVERVVKLIGAILNPPVAPEKARASDDFFDKGLGLLVKKSVYACCVLLVLWEVYLSSPAIDRKAPMISVEEALVGYPVPAKTVM